MINWFLRVFTGGMFLLISACNEISARNRFKRIKKK